MPDAATLKAFLDLGVPTAVLLLLIGSAIYAAPKIAKWYSADSARRDKLQTDLTEQMIQAVTNNTAALSKLCSNTDETTDRLKDHDQRAAHIEDVVNRIDGTTKRIETAVSQGKGQ